MLRSRLALFFTVAAALVTVAGCGGSSVHSSPAGTTASSIASGATTQGDPTSDSPSFVNGGSALADSDTLVFVLEAVNPKIDTSKDDLVAKSKALCAHVNAKESESQLETDASTGFTNGAWVPSSSEAQAIVGTVKAYGGC